MARRGEAAMSNSPAWRGG
ncbi:unnamed protein product, partial [Rotaria magnacalcarata]